MSPRMSQSCALVLLLAMSLALAVGLLAWGPVQLGAADHLYADQRGWAGVPNVGRDNHLGRWNDKHDGRW